MRYQKCKHCIAISSKNPLVIWKTSPNECRILLWDVDPKNNQNKYESTYNTTSYHSPRQCAQGCTADTVDHWTMAHTSGSRYWRHNRYNVSHTPNSLYQTDSLHILDHAKRQHLYLSMIALDICLHHSKIFWSYLYIHNYIHICLFSFAYYIRLN